MHMRSRDCCSVTNRLRGVKVRIAVLDVMPPVDSQHGPFDRGTLDDRAPLQVVHQLGVGRAGAPPRHSWRERCRQARRTLGLCRRMSWTRAGEAGELDDWMTGSEDPHKTDGGGDKEQHPCGNAV